MKQQNFFQKITSWSLAHASWITMAISPVALGKEAEAKNTLYYKQFINELGLDKQMTVKEFWNKVKGDLPGSVYFEIEQLYLTNPNALMPKFEVKSSKTSDGQVIPVISFSENGKNNTVQIFADKDKYIKFNGVVMNETDSKNPAQMFQKLMDADPKLQERYKKDVKKLRLPSSSKENTTSTKFNFSSMNKDQWKAMTMEQRVTYIIQMRLMAIEARKINLLNNKQDTSSFNYLEGLYKAMFQVAEAQAKKTVVKKQPVNPYDAKSCVVAGYIGKYVNQVSNVNGQKRPGCSFDAAVEVYKDKPQHVYVKNANINCEQQKGQGVGVACNPIIYGYQQSGNPICIHKKSDEFQIATHWEGPCDKESRLTSKKGILDLSSKDYSKITPRDAQIEAIKKDQAEQSFILTKNFITGVLARDKADKALAALFKDGIWSEALENEINRIGKHFDDEIEAAIKICETDIVGKHEKNQKGACDQLHQRKLFVSEIIKDLKCPAGEEFDKSTPRKCVKKVDPPPVIVIDCPTGSKEAKIPKGEKCQCEHKDYPGQYVPFEPSEAFPVDCQKAIDPVPEPVVSCSQYPPLTVAGGQLNEDCTCKGTANFPKEDQPGLFSKLFNTKKNKTFKVTETQNRIHSCKFGPNWWAVAGIGVGVAGLVALIAMKRKTKTITNTVYQDREVIKEVEKEVIKEVIVEKPVDRLLCDKAGDYVTSAGKCCNMNACSYTDAKSGVRSMYPQNPVSCSCESEGGSNDSGSDNGGVPSSTNK